MLLLFQYPRAERLRWNRRRRRRKLVSGRRGQRESRRFRYIAQYNVFVLVNRADENVFFYKHTAGCGP
ncbi:hypothetical protein [Polyangium sp. 6x1]|uniref:hypothetical protein n=1 Tax=Polyangium sp. 6x1 TaxID=3042689 RepID=UPI0024828701|nr:hypothetical protein [Polyangium sp. 6x1]MDI1450127.1 hypothetical protein [Polyangium sp. 6x1]